VSVPEPVDHGLASERTDLAWNRSGLAIATCIAVLLRRIWPLDATSRVVALACISLGSGMWALALLMGRAVSRPTGGERRSLSPARAGAITAATVALAIAAFVLGFFPPS
jgi:uncharacterized membrane protein YidH (DUF202 family)